MKILVALRRAVDDQTAGWLAARNLLGASVFRHRLGAFRYGVLGQLSGQEQSNSGLNLATGDGGSFVVVSQTRCFGGNALEDVVDEAVHDRHGLAGNTSIGMDLLQHFVNVDAVRLLPAAALLLVASASGFRLRRGLLGSLATDLGRHGVLRMSEL